MPNICSVKVNGKDVWISSAYNAENDESLYYGESEHRSGQNTMPYGIVLRNGEFYDKNAGKILSKFDVADRIKNG